MTIKIPVSAELNQQQITGQIEQVRDALNNLGRDAQGAGKIKFEPINSVSLENVKKMRAEFEAIVKMSPGLKKALDSSGQGGKSFDEVRWGKVWTDDKQRREHAATLLRRLAPKSVTDNETPSVPRPNDRPGAVPSPGTGGWRRAGFGAAAGIAGGVASQIGGIGGGAASGALAGGLAGGPIGAAVGGLAGAITSLLGAIGEARDIAVGLDTLKRTLGDTNVSFKDLQDSTRSLADEYSLADTEASALTKRYASLSGSGKDVGALRNEVGVGVGFSRSFGLDPAAGVGFFGQMQGMGITHGADDSKKLALLIGESVAKAGDLPRLGDVLAGLTRFMEGASRTSLTNPNSAAWLSRFAGLENSGLAGMDPTTAASIIGSIDGSIRQGGITEAGKNFMNGSLQRDQGLNTIQAAIQLEGGAFGTGRSTFGADSPMSRFYARFGGGSPLNSWSADESNVSVLQRNLVKQYKGKPPELMLDAFKNTFGTSYGQSAAWMASDPRQNDSMLKRMQRLGINWKDVNASGVSKMSQIEANGSLSETDKDSQIRKAAANYQEDTVGSEARRASIDGSNAMIRVATEGLPMLSSIQAGVLKLAGMDALSPQKAALKSEHEKRMSEIDNGPLAAERGKAVQNYKKVVPLWKQISGVGLNDEEQQAKDWLDTANSDLSSARQAEDDKYNSGLDVLNTTPSPGISSGAMKPTGDLLDRAAESDKKAGLPPGTTAGLMMQESGFNPNAVSSAGALGMHQIMPSNIKSLSKRAGRNLDPTNTEDSFYMYDELMAERKRKYGSDTDKMLRSYHGGYDESEWGKINADYIPAIERRKRELAGSGAPTTMSHKVEVDVTMRDQSGNPMNNAAINTSVGKPTVSGATP